jgi:hypothetical protein
MGDPFLLRPSPQSFTKAFIPLGTLEQPIEQGPQVQSRPARQDGKTPAPPNILEDNSRATGKVSRRKRLVGFQQVNQMMRNALAVLTRRFRTADVKVFEHLDGIIIDYLSPEF